MIGELESRQHTAPVTFSFRGLDIRHKLPDRKGVGIRKRVMRAQVLLGFPHPRTARDRSKSIIGHTASNGNGANSVRRHISSKFLVKRIFERAYGKDSCQGGSLLRTAAASRLPLPPLAGPFLPATPAPENQVR